MKKILLIDDEESLCRFLKLNLEETGKYEVLTDTDGHKAVGHALVFNPDLIILDFMMPGLDGADVARQLGDNPQTKSIPIIFLTAIATNEDTQQEGAMISGRYVIAKPVTTEKLIEGIEKNLKP